jgi:MFS family permease
MVFILPGTAPLWQSFGWACLTNFFWVPGAILGAFLSDWIGAKRCLILGVTLQGIVGFAMTAAYPKLNRPDAVGGFVVLYGVFLALGEVGPGANIGLLASKLAGTGVRGHFYGVAAGWGKVGAFLVRTPSACLFLLSDAPINYSLRHLNGTRRPFKTND